MSIINAVWIGLSVTFAWLIIFESPDQYRLLSIPILAQAVFACHGTARILGRKQERDETQMNRIKRVSQTQHAFVMQQLDEEMKKKGRVLTNDELKDFMNRVGWGD
jgi:hypothetical protein